MQDAAVFLAAGIGLCAGSFANVLIQRLPRDQPVVRGRSRCPHCGATIAWHDNVPLLSWALLAGRCRHCQGSIPLRYPLVEGAVAVIAALSVRWLGPSTAALWTFVFFYALLVVAIIDARDLVIPHQVTVGGLIAGLALAPLAGPGLAPAGLGAVVGGVTMLAIARTYRRLRGRDGLGGGDVMLLAMIGAYLGPAGALATLGLGSALGVLSLVVMGGRLQWSRRLPFGPFLAVGAGVVLLWGSTLWRWNLALAGGGTP